MEVEGLGYFKKMFKNVISSLLNKSSSPWTNLRCLFHKSSALSGKKWDAYNTKVYPPQSPDEPPRPAFVCHSKKNIKYSYKKMWYIACLVRGMTVDEALKQLLFVKKKGALVVRETILEAQKLAVEEHNVEFKSNLWVSESFTGKAMVIKGLRRHGKGRMGRVSYRYCHYFVTLEEGTPPKHYYPFSRIKSGEELLNEWLEKMRQRKVMRSL